MTDDEAQPPPKTEYHKALEGRVTEEEELRDEQYLYEARNDEARDIAHDSGDPRTVVVLEPGERVYTKAEVAAKVAELLDEGKLP